MPTASAQRPAAVAPAPAVREVPRRPRLDPLRAVIAVAVAALAFNGGGFDLEIRNPVGIAVWWALALAVALAVWPRARVPRAGLLCAALLGGYALLAGISSAWADSAEGAIGEAGRAAMYLGVFGLVLVASRRGSAARWSDGLGIGIAAVGVVALASRLIPSLGFDDAALRLFEAGGYLSFPLDYWNGVAAFVALGYPPLLRIAVDGRRTWARALAVAPLPALAGALYLTSSRGGVLTAMVGLAVFILLAGDRMRALAATAVALAGSAATVLILAGREQLVDGPFGTAEVASQGRSVAILIAVACAGTAAAWHLIAPLRLRAPRVGRRARLAAVALAAVALVAAAAVADVGTRVDSFTAPPPNPFAESAAPEEDLATGSHLLSGSSSGRWQFWEAAVDQFAAHPLAGGGAGSYEAWWAQHGSIPYFTRHAHSLYLQVLGELGLAGLLLLAALLAVVAVTALSRRRSATADRTTIAALAGVAGAFMVGAGIDWTWHIPVLALIGLTSFALLTGPATAPAGAPAPAGRRGRAGVVAAAAVAIVLLALPWLSARDITRSRDAALAGSVSQARDAARSAQGWQPWAASPRLQHALVLEGAGDLNGARRQVREAVERNPTDWRLALVEARIAEAAGDTLAAAAALERARELNPRSPLFMSGRDPSK